MSRKIGNVCFINLCSYTLVKEERSIIIKQITLMCAIPFNYLTIFNSGGIAQMKRVFECNFGFNFNIPDMHKHCAALQSVYVAHNQSRLHRAFS